MSRTHLEAAYPDPQLPAPDDRFRGGYPAPPYDPFAAGAEHQEEAFDLKRYLAILLHRKWLLIFAVLVSLIVGVVMTVRTTPMYRATAVVQATPPSASKFGFTDYSVWQASANFMGDQIQFLKSTVFAQRMARDLRIDFSSESTQSAPPDSFFTELRSQLNAWLSGLRGDDDTKPSFDDGSRDLGLEPQSSKQAQVERIIRGQLKITAVPKTNLLNLSVVDSDPRRAAAIVNAVAKTYVAVNMERRYQDSGNTKDFYDRQVTRTRAELEEIERSLIAYARGKDLVNLDDLLQYHEKEFTELKSLQFQAEQRLFKAEAKLSAISDPEGYSGEEFLKSQVMQQLKTRRWQLEDEYQRKLEIYLPDYPEMLQLKSQIDTIDRQVAKEVAAIARSIELAYETAKREHESLAERVSELREDLLSVRDQTADYQALKREHLALQSVYDGLMGRIKEAGIVADVGANNVTIFDLASPPSMPFEPDLKANLTKAVLVGLLLGVVLIFLLESLDDSVKSQEDVERLDLPILGHIPFVGQQRANNVDEDDSVRILRDPKGPIAEASRSLRTTLLFSSSEGAPRVLHFASAGPSEGKSVACCATALAFAQSGATVLCIDGDLRNPSLHKIFNVQNKIGLTNHLVSDVPASAIAQPTEFDGLFVIPSGPLPPNPVDLLSSRKMTDLLALAVERFDHVFIDGPPVLGLADALVMSRLAGATLFVVEPGQTRRGALKDSLKRLRAGQARLLGGVFQKVGRQGSSYGYGYGYKYNYQYLYGYGRSPREVDLV